MIQSSPERIAEYQQRGWWGQTTVDDVFRDAVARAGAEEAVVDPPNKDELTGAAQQRYTFAELDRLVDGLASRLLALGLRKDDVLATQLPNTVEGVVAFLACARLGLVFCPVAMQFREHELRYILGKSGASAFMTVPRFKDTEPAARAEALVAEFDRLRHLLVWREQEADPTDLSLERLAGADPEPLRAYLEELEIDPHETLTLCWTSGTESRPKGVPRHHAHWVVNGESCSECGQLQEGENILNPFPMVNIASLGGMVMPWLMTRGKLVQHHPFDLPVFLRQMAEEKINYTVAPPAILNLLLKNDDLLAKTDISHLRCIGSGSAPLAPWMVKGWQEQHGIVVVNIFGSNEGCSLFSTGEDFPDPEDRALYFPRFGVEGLEWPSQFQKKIITCLKDPETGEVINEPGRPGELCFDGAMRFDGYWQDDELNAEVIDADGFYHSGDLFELVDDGEPIPRRYRFIGRVKELIIRGGMNISPAELDSLVESHPALQEAAVFGIPDEVLGEKVCAAVVPRPGESVTLDDVVEHLKSLQVASYKWPQEMVVLEALPRNPLGKVLRRDLTM